MRRTDFLRVVRKQVPSTDVEESQRVDVVSTAKSVNKAVWNAVRSNKMLLRSHSNRKTTPIKCMISNSDARA